jgi:antitoxin component YwqK of YwqJK toxin-antitoxin module
VIALVLAALLAAGARAPLECPKGAERRGAAPPEGFEEWCEGKDVAGQPRREGPARIYYDDGGLWIDERWHEGKRDGPFRELHRGGGKAREGAFTAGLKTGRWVTYRESGLVEEDGDWKDGVPHGRFVSYWATGKKRAEGRHCGGVQCGTWKSYDDAGTEIGSVDYGEQKLEP